MVLISDRDDQLELPFEIAKSLCCAGLIYPCPYCGVFHLRAGYSWDDIDVFLDKVMPLLTIH